MSVSSDEVDGSVTAVQPSTEAFVYQITVCVSTNHPFGTPTMVVDEMEVKAGLVYAYVDVVENTGGTAGSCGSGTAPTRVTFEANLEEALTQVVVEVRHVSGGEVDTKLLVETF